MEQLKQYLPVICALVMALGLFTIDSTAYHNAANEVDFAKAFGAFVTLWGLFTGFFKLNFRGDHDGVLQFRGRSEAINDSRL